MAMNRRRCWSKFRLTFFAGCVGLLPASRAAAQDGTWVANTSGFWSSSLNWQLGVVANGQDKLASFEATLTASRTVTLDVSRTIGHLGFSDQSGSGFTTTIAGNGFTLQMVAAGNLPQIITHTPGTISGVSVAAPFFQIPALEKSSRLQGTGSNLVSLDSTRPSQVSEGTLLLAKSNGVVSMGTVIVNGGSLVWGASDQVHDSAIVEVSSGTANFNLWSETVGMLSYNGGQILNVPSAGLNLSNNANNYHLHLRNVSLGANLNLNGSKYRRRALRCHEQRHGHRQW